MSADPLPRRSLFAIWRWPRWVLWTLVIMTPLIYLLSEAPVAFMLLRSGSYTGDPTLEWVDDYAHVAIYEFYAPAKQCRNNSPFLQNVWMSEIQMMKWIFNEPDIRLESPKWTEIEIQRWEIEKAMPTIPSNEPPK